MAYVLKLSKETNIDVLLKFHPEIQVPDFKQETRILLVTKNHLIWIHSEFCDFRPERRGRI